LSKFILTCDKLPVLHIHCFRATR